MNPELASRLHRRIAGEFQRHERAECRPDFPRLPAIPVARYTSQAFWNLEQRHLWPKVWLMAGHRDEIPHAGSVKSWTDSGVPIILVRGKDDKVRAFHNTCQHRGGPLVMADQGKSGALSCKVHGWTYDLEGRLKFVPDAHEFPGLDMGRHNLRELRCELWGPFIFVNRDADAATLSDYLGPLVEEFRDYDFESRRVLKVVEYEVEANWKLGIESNAEIYHFPVAHKESVNPIFSYRGAPIDLFRNGHSRMVVPYAPGSADLLNLGARSLTKAPWTEGMGNYTVFPNFLCSASEFQFPLITYWPLAPNRSRIVLYYTSAYRDDHAGSPGLLEVVKANEVALREDGEPLAWMQKSYEAGAIEGVTFSHAEQRLYYLNEAIDKVIGIDNIPSGLGVQPLLQSFVREGE